jgi:flagellar biosynthesis protein FliR
MKQNPRALAIIASLVFVMQFVYILWTISPSFHPKFFIHWADIAVPVAIGGLWASVLIGLLRRRVPQLLATNQL